MTHPTFEHEHILWQQGYKYVAGVDEVGRGCFAGPVVAAAVILPQGFNATNEINDSKLLSAKKREKLVMIIQKNAFCYAIAEIDVTVINKIGVGKAAQQAFYQAIMRLSQIPEFILIDAFSIDRFPPQIQKPIIHGDRLSISIAAASIIAKVYRDALMKQLHETYPLYDFASNKGYGTKKHREAIGKHGLCKLHRKSFDLKKYVSTQTEVHGHGTVSAV